MLKKPTQCILWKDPELIQREAMKKGFELIDTYAQESHWWRYLLKCRECGQLYFFEFYEEIDWIGGNDPQYSTYIPVETQEEIETLKKTSPLTLLKFSPRLQSDWPAKANKRKIYWVGKEDPPAKKRVIKAMAKETSYNVNMVFTPLIQKAVRFSLKTHEVYQKQKRKGKDIPYITHPLAVGLILARAGASEDVIAAGILHDTIEDSVQEKKVTREMLSERFSEKVAALVENVTETQKDLPWEDRKKEALEHIESFSNDAILVKSADVISNISELLDDQTQEGERVWDRFNASKEMFLENTYRVITSLRRRWPESPLSRDLDELRDRLVSIETRFVEGSTKGFFIGGVRDGIPDRWFVRYLSESNLGDYVELGQGGSPLGMTFHMMLNHSPGKYEKVAGYVISEEGIGKMMNEEMKKQVPDHAQAQPGMRFTYILYQEKAG